MNALFNVYIRVDQKVTHDSIFCVGIAAVMLNFHRFIVPGFHYRHNLLCPATEREA